MKLSTLDYWSTSDAGFLNRLHPGIKLCGVAAIITLVILTWNPWVLAACAGALILLCTIAKLPTGFLIKLALYPLLFTGLLVLTTLPGWSAAAALLLKGFTAALAVLLLALSTPYPQLFSLIGRFLPRLLSDALLLTYRTLFLLADELSALTTALRLRAALTWRHPMTLFRIWSSTLANLMLFALELAQDDYDILRMRGYDGTLRLSTPASRAEAQTKAAPKEAAAPTNAPAQANAAESAHSKEGQ